jgi:hypothetical protein
MIESPDREQETRKPGREQASARNVCQAAEAVKASPR